jgi:hypothetical protein
MATAIGASLVVAEGFLDSNAKNGWDVSQKCIPCVSDPENYAYFKTPPELTSAYPPCNTVPGVNIQGYCTANESLPVNSNQRNSANTQCPTFKNENSCNTNYSPGDNCTWTNSTNCVDAGWCVARDNVNCTGDLYDYKICMTNNAYEITNVNDCCNYPISLRQGGTGKDNLCPLGPPPVCSSDGTPCPSGKYKTTDGVQSLPAGYTDCVIL